MNWNYKWNNNKWTSFVLVFVLISGLLILPSHSTQAQPNSSQEVFPIYFQDIVWYEDKAIFTTNAGMCRSYANWMIAEQVDNAWKVTHGEDLPSVLQSSFSTTLYSIRLHIFNDTLYLLASNYCTSEIDPNTTKVYRYNLETLSYIDEITFPTSSVVHDFVLTSDGKMIVLTDEGLYTFENGSLHELQAIDTIYHELAWLTETNLCIGSFHNQYPKDGVEPITDLLQYNVVTQELSTLFEGDLPVYDIAVAADQTIYALTKNPATESVQLYYFKDGVFSLYDPIQRLSRWSRVLIAQDKQTPITVTDTWSNPILYYKNNNSIKRQPMQFALNNQDLQYPVCLHAAENQTSVLVNQGICICEEATTYSYPTQWKDTGLQIPYETCNDIVKLSEQTFLVLNDYEFCIVDSNEYRFSESFYYDNVYFNKIIQYKGEYYVWSDKVKNRTSTSILNKINLEDCTLHSASIADLPEGIVTVSDETIYVFNGEVIFKGILTDNSFIEQEVLPIPDYYWLYMSWDELLYNPANKNFIAVDTTPFQIQAGFFKYNEQKEPEKIGFIYYHHIEPSNRYADYEFPCLLNGHVSFITHEGYGRLLQF